MARSSPGPSPRVVAGVAAGRSPDGTSMRKGFHTAGVRFRSCRRSSRRRRRGEAAAGGRRRSPRSSRSCSRPRCWSRRHRPSRSPRPARGAGGGRPLDGDAPGPAGGRAGRRPVDGRRWHGRRRRRERRRRRLRRPGIHPDDRDLRHHRPPPARRSRAPRHRDDHGAQRLRGRCGPRPAQLRDGSARRPLAGHRHRGRGDRPAHPPGPDDHRPAGRRPPRRRVDHDRRPVRRPPAVHHRGLDLAVHPRQRHRPSTAGYRGSAARRRSTARISATRS